MTCRGFDRLREIHDRGLEQVWTGNPQGWLASRLQIYVHETQCGPHEEDDVRDLEDCEAEFAETGVRPVRHCRTFEITDDLKRAAAEWYEEQGLTDTATSMRGLIRESA